jgi:hypothetical protein
MTNADNEDRSILLGHSDLSVARAHVRVPLLKVLCMEEGDGLRELFVEPLRISFDHLILNG